MLDQIPDVRHLYQIPYSPLIQWLLLAVYTIMLYYSTELNEYFDEKYGDRIKYAIFAIPLLVIFVLDMLYHSFSLNNLRLTQFIPNSYLNYILRILGIYGVIQVLSQDFGIKTGLLQNQFTKIPVIHFLCMFGGGFALTGQRSESFLGALLYFFLRRLVSNNKTTQACFEEV